MANEASPCPCDIGHRLEYGGMGREVQVEHIRAYVTRPPADTGKAVIVVQDIFGWELPNTRTIVPDFFVGKEPWSPSADMKTFPEWFKSRDARKVDKEVDAVLRYLTQQCGAQKVGIVGFCWGGIVVHHVMTKYRQIRAGVSSTVSLLTQKLKQHCRVDHQVKTFTGQTHGFVHRKKEDCQPADKPYIDEARRNLVEWLHKFV